MKRITILKGAGFSGVSTWELTNRIIKRKVDRIKINNLNPGEYFYRRLCRFYTQDKTAIECDVADVNFETILHTLEEIYSFYASKTNGNQVINSNFKGIKPAIFRVRKFVAEHLKSTISDDLKYHQIIRLIYNNLLDEIINQIKPYQNNPNHQRFIEFKNFLDSELNDSIWIKRIYTLNYDSWLSTHKNYYDGFNSNGVFESENVLSNRDFNCNYNLHGSILWESDINKNRITKNIKTPNLLNTTVSSTFDIRREPLLSSPIISGYNKSARMKFSPYLQFFYSFQRDIIESDLILIVGYGYNDSHINNILELSNVKNIIVEYFSEWVKQDDSGNPINTFDNSVLYKLKNKIISNDGFGDGDELIRKPWIESKDKLHKIWWKGIGNNFYENWNEIIK